MRFDFWALLLAVFFPIIAVWFNFDEIFAGEFHLINKLLTGLIFLLHPLFTFLFLMIRNVEDSDILFVLYSSFFLKKLYQQDLGRIIAFYITFMTNIIGLILILWFIYERAVIGIW